uniref:Large ribosomal subunit protein bL32c n=1 Tax=Euglena anabaena TaxID=38273 RepID=A0A0G3FD50_EUGAN|nr:ribosomal protein L32 [Euglenaria anabaena]AKJ83342.1 ribosomal protein L32 [Euglenaria anabaena]
MAVPKKKMSKSKRDSRKNTWKKKIKKNVLVALSIGKGLLKEKTQSNIIIS